MDGSEVRRDIPYGRTFFYQRALGLLAVSVLVLVILGVQTRTPPEWLALIAAILFVYLTVVGLSPLLTEHRLTRSRIILRQGWYFRAVLPLEEAESIGPWDGEPKYGLRFPLGGGRLYVVGSRENLVAVRLQEPRRFPQVLFLRAKEIVFDVDDRDAFLEAVAARVEAGEVLPARKVPVLPAGR